MLSAYLNQDGIRRNILTLFSLIKRPYQHMYMKGSAINLALFLILICPKSKPAQVMDIFKT